MMVTIDLNAARELLCTYKRLRPGSNPLDGRSIIAEILDFEFPDDDEESATAD